MAPFVRSFDERERNSLVQLWARCELTRPWNDPSRDIDRKLASDPENLLVLEDAGKIIGSVLVGYDGHRGWINYLAVDPGYRRQGLASQLMAEAELRLRDLGCPKINLQVRSSNLEAFDFYSRIGYSVDDVISLGKRLEVDQ